MFERERGAGIVTSRPAATIRAPIARRGRRVWTSSSLRTCSPPKAQPPGNAQAN